VTTDSPRKTTCDLLFTAGLLATSILLLAPLFGDHLLTYMDSPVHIAELEDMVTYGYGSWSELAFCGFPLSTLHSPLWYGLLTLLGGIGVPITVLYMLALIAATVATPLAIYFVGRRHTASWFAWLIAYLYLVLPTHTVGFSSAAGGMWTFHLGTALLVFLIDAVASVPGSKSRLLRITALLALIGLTHHFVLVTAALVCVVGFVVHAIRRSAPFSMHVTEVPCWGIAALASIVYWGPTLFVNDVTSAGSQNLSVAGLWLRILMPTNLVLLLPGSIGDPIRYDLGLTESLATLALLLLAGLAVWKSRRTSSPSLLYIGFILVLLLLGFLMLAPYNAILFLGPVSWRFVTHVHLGLALMAVSGMFLRSSSRSGFRTSTLSPRRALLLVTLAAASAFWWNQPLAQSDHPDSARDQADLRSAWEWLSENRDPSGSTVSYRSVPAEQSRIQTADCTAKGIRRGIQQGAFFHLASERCARHMGSVSRPGHTGSGRGV